MQETQRKDLPESFRRELFYGENDKDLHQQMNERLTSLDENLVSRTKLHDRSACPCGSGKIFKNCCKGKSIIPDRKEYTNEQIMEKLITIENKLDLIFGGHVLVNGNFIAVR